MPNLIIRANSAAGIFSSGVSGDGDNIFVADFSDNSSGFYNFATKEGTNGPSEGPAGPHGSYVHLPTGGPGGTPCVEMTQFPNHYQYALDFTTPGNSVDWGTGVGQQGEIWYRYIIRVEAGSRFDFETSGGKFIDHASGANRTIIWMGISNGIGGGVSNLGDSYDGDEFGNALYTTNPRAVPSYFGLTGSSSNSWETNYYGRFGSIGVSRGTGPKVAPPALITSVDNVIQPRPGPLGAGVAPTNGWYYVQVRVKFGNTPYNSSNVANPTPHSMYEIWVNNNDLNNPTCRQFVWGQVAEGAPITGAGYTGGVHVGNYVGGGTGSVDTTKNFVYRLAGYEHGLSGRDDYYPG